MNVKICGLKTLEDGLVACEAGADLLGFNFYKFSPRYLEPKVCRNIVRELKSLFPTVTIVGIFVNHTSDVIDHLIKYCQLDLVQLSGNESPKTLDAIGQKAYKAFRPRNLEDIEYAGRCMKKRRMPPVGLVDTYHPNTFGGGGKVGDWSFAKKMATRFPILLAGGLTPENVGEAIRTVNPWGVDVASGVEEQRGVKDHKKIRAFIQQARLYGNIKRRIINDAF